MISTFLQRQGRAEEAAAYLRRFYNQQDVEERVAAERQSLRKSDTLLPHELSPELLKRLRSQLSAVAGDITALYLVRKAVQFCPDRQCFVLAIKRRTGMIDVNTEAKDSALAGAVLAVLEQVTLPGSVVVVSMNQNTWLEKRMQAVPSARVSLPAQIPVA